MGQMKELYNMVMSDAALRERAESILFSDQKDASVRREELFAFARELGYDVTEEEAVAFFEGMQMQGDLTDEELDMVAGGKKTSPLTVCLSVISFGFSCLLISAASNTLKKDSCQRELENLKL